MKHTRKNKRFRKRKQTKRNNYRKKRPTGGSIPGFEDVAHIGKNGLLLNFNICGMGRKCNDYLEDPLGFKKNDGFLNTGYNIDNGHFLLTEPFKKDNRILEDFDKVKQYESYEIIYDKSKGIKENLDDANSMKFLENNKDIQILFKIIFSNGTNGVIIVKSYENKYIETLVRYSYIYVEVDTDSNKRLKGQKVGDSEIIELYRKHGNLNSFRNYK